MPPIRAQLPKGMRDFLPDEVLRRERVIGTITDVFQTFGFEPIQTPVAELREILLGKAGEDAEKLIYYAQHPGGKEELALRYDLTVPLARFFAQHESELSLPFKRYHIAPVWRGERPARGRYREFYQCDADIVGIEGMDADAEVINLVVVALEKLGFADVVIKINHRQLLIGIGHYAGVSGEALGSLYRTVDKTDKIGLDGVREEFRKNGLPEEVITRMLALLDSTRQIANLDSSRALIGKLREMLGASSVAVAGLAALELLLKNLQALNVDSKRVAVDLTMVRGLSYYTGPIFEAVLTSDDPEERVGSVAGGGRYDELIGLFRKDSLPTVGASLGIERLIDLMEKRGSYSGAAYRTVVQVLVTVFNQELHAASLGLAADLRKEGIHTELFMQDKPVGRQIGYADKKGIPFVALLGPDEIKAGKIRLKRLSDGVEQSVPAQHAARAIHNWLDLDKS